MESLTEQLQHHATNSAKRIPEDEQEIMKSAINALKTAAMLEKAYKTGDMLPDIELENASGTLISLNQILTSHKMVLVFYRGGWCPYCNLELRALQSVLPKIEAKGAKLIAISPESPDNSLNTREKNKLDFEILTDTNNLVAKRLNLVFKMPDSLITLYKEQFKIDIEKSQENTNSELPIAATYIIEQNGKISYHFLNEDYKLRADPQEILHLL